MTDPKIGDLRIIGEYHRPITTGADGVILDAEREECDPSDPLAEQWWVCRWEDTENDGNPEWCPAIRCDSLAEAEALLAELLAELKAGNLPKDRSRKAPQAEKLPPSDRKTEPAQASPKPSQPDYVLLTKIFHQLETDNPNVILESVAALKRGLAAHHLVLSDVSLVAPHDRRRSLIKMAEREMERRRQMDEVVGVLLRAMPRQILDLYREWSYSRDQEALDALRKGVEKVADKEPALLRQGKAPKSSSSGDKPVRSRDGNARHQQAWRERQQSRLVELEKLADGLASACQEYGCRLAT